MNPNSKITNILYDISIKHKIDDIIKDTLIEKKTDTKSVTKSDTKSDTKTDTKTVTKSDTKTKTNSDEKITKIEIDITNVVYKKTEYTYEFDYKTIDFKLTKQNMQKQITYTTQKIKEYYKSQITERNIKKQGQCIILIGHPGSGKSTIGNIVIDEYMTKNNQLSSKYNYDSFLSFDPDKILEFLPLYTKYAILDVDESSKIITINKAVVENGLIRKIIRKVTDNILDFILKNKYNFIYETLWRDREWYNMVFKKISLESGYNPSTCGNIYINILKTLNVDDAILGNKLRMYNIGRYVNDDFVKESWEQIDIYINDNVIYQDLEDLKTRNKIEYLPKCINHIIVEKKNDKTIELEIENVYINYDFKYKSIDTDEEDGEEDGEEDEEETSVLKQEIEDDLKYTKNMIYESEFLIKPRNIFSIQVNKQLKLEKTMTHTVYHNEKLIQTLFIYPINQELDGTRDIETTYDLVDGVTKLHILSYTIQKDEVLKPYIEYHFAKSSKESGRLGNTLYSPYIKYDKSKTVMEQCIEYLREITLDKEGNKYSDEELIKNYIGLTKISSKNYFVFFEIPTRIKDIDIIKSEQQFGWWTTIDEIVNERNSVNFPIMKHIYDFFQKNPSFCNLLKVDTETNKYEVIETPKVCFHGTNKETIPLIQEYGMKPASVKPMMGPYYYFGLFRKAVRYAAWTSDKQKRYNDDGKQIADENGKYYDVGGIIRFNVFLGHIKAFLNHDLDPKDKSEQYKEKAKIDPEYENKILRMHDHEGKWVNDDRKYDTAYVGRAKLSDGSKFMTNPEFVIKDYDSVNYMSYYHIDSETIPSKWNAKATNYMIL
jgi:energy-coupling factor transporter ATP-binding protein EcfA2